MTKFKLTNTVLVLLCIVLIGIPTYAQEATSKLDGLDKEVKKILKDWDVPGVGIAVVHKDKVILAKGYGLRDVDNKLPATEHTLFAIGSTSKAFTATALCKIADEGMIDLDEPIKTYLSDFEMHDEYATKKLTARDLLCHRSGLPRHDLVWFGSPKSRKELYRSLKYLEPTTSFRDTWQYQNLMFMTAGYLLEQVTGQSWEAYVKTNFFEPLEMGTANTSVEASQKMEDFSLGYRSADKKVLRMPFKNIDAIGPAGSINASAREMANWVVMQLNGGQYKDREIIGATALSQTHQPQMAMPPSLTDEFFYGSYGLGWMISAYRGKLMVGHGGNIDGFSASVALYPRDSIGIVVLTNMNATGVTGVLRNTIADRMLDLEKIDWSDRQLKAIQKNREAQEAAATNEEEDLVRKKGTKPSHPESDYAGRYEHPAYGVVTIKKGKEGLMLDYHVLDEALALQHYHYDVFQVEFRGQKIKFWFELDQAGDIQQLVSELETGVDPIIFERALEVKDLSEKELDVYVGVYEMQGVPITVSNKEGSLRMLVPGQPEYTLLPVKQHEFNLKGLDGYKAIFKVGERGEKASAIVSVQPNGSFTIPRKKE